MIPSISLPRLIALAAIACAWLAAPAIASENRGGAVLPARDPVQPAAADRTLGSAIMVAKVDDVLVGGTGVVSSSKTGVGLYALSFDRSVRDCGYLGAASTTGPGSAFGFGLMVTAGPDAAAANVLRIAIYSANGTLTDAPFHVQVTCWK